MQVGLGRIIFWKVEGRVMGRFLACDERSKSHENWVNELELRSGDRSVIMFTLKLIAQLNLERNCLIPSSSLRSSQFLTRP